MVVKQVQFEKFEQQEILNYQLCVLCTLQIRAHLARESIQDLQAVSEENSNLLRESLSLSLLGSVDDSDESMDSLSD